jgi:NADH-quinone oxidoreductase subunit A
MLVFALAVFVSFVYLIGNGALDWGPVKRLRAAAGAASAGERSSTSTIKRVSSKPTVPSQVA